MNEKILSKEQIHRKADEFRSELKNDLVVNVKLAEVTEKIKNGKLQDVKHKAVVLLNKKYCTPTTKANFQILLMTLSNVKDESLQKKVQTLAKKI